MASRTHCFWSGGVSHLAPVRNRSLWLLDHPGDTYVWWSRTTCHWHRAVGIWSTKHANHSSPKHSMRLA